MGCLCDVCFFLEDRLGEVVCGGVVVLVEEVFLVWLLIIEILFVGKGGFSGCFVGFVFCYLYKI